ncbi:hypothetical protein AN964_13165 [Heyndrickxia shackletonii]|uniref:Uncharacterized protein n=1 Tax=Heyndrickxia shackletonii TaxID=157838 RepID=A0A0Q3TK22_9BACI|nr:hypothetical protein AN964_13165 [Heyndrickxia shackletonii]
MVIFLLLHNVGENLVSFGDQVFWWYGCCWDSGILRGNALSLGNIEVEKGYIERKEGKIDLWRVTCNWIREVKKHILNEVQNPVHNGYVRSHFMK